MKAIIVMVCSFLVLISTDALAWTRFRCQDDMQNVLEGSLNSAKALSLRTDDSSSFAKNLKCKFDSETTLVMNCSSVQNNTSFYSQYISVTGYQNRYESKPVQTTTLKFVFAYISYNDRGDAVESTREFIFKPEQCFLD